MSSVWGSFEQRVINLNNKRQVDEIRSFLTGFNLTFDEVVDYTVGIYYDDKLVATGSLKGEVLRNIAVDEAMQGEGLTAKVISHLMHQAATRGIYHYFIFTKAEKAHLFSGLGFKEIARAEPYVALLEAGIGGIDKYLEDLSQLAGNLPQGKRAGLVVNCNPFTLGHRAVIEKASKENDSVIVMVVSEDRSLFPMNVRIELVRKGVEDLKNVLVIPGGKYVISSATFPGYFTRGDETVYAQTRLDAVIYGKYITKSLKIDVRYVGEEPYCPVTCSYNEALKEILPKYGVDVIVIPRIAQAGEAVSASRVRDLIRSDRWEEIKTLVPASTYRYLISDDAKSVVDKIKNSTSRH